MIIEIAIGVAVGIVLGVFVLRNWRTLIESATSLALVIGLIVAFGAIGSFLWKRVEIVATYALAVFLVCVLYGVPLFLYRRFSHRFSSLGALLRGEPPWNTPTRLPLRLVTMILFAFVVAFLGVFAMMLAGILVSAVSEVLTKASA
jgi:hypothetical protein